MNRAAEIMWQKATIFAQRSEVIKKNSGRRTAAVQDASRYMVLTLIPTGFGLRLSFCRFCCCRLQSDTINRAAEIMWQKATIFAPRSELIKKKRQKDSRSPKTLRVIWC